METGLNRGYRPNGWKNLLPLRDWIKPAWGFGSSQNPSKRVNLSVARAESSGFVHSLELRVYIASNEALLSHQREPAHQLRSVNNWHSGALSPALLEILEIQA